MGPKAPVDTIKTETESKATVPENTDDEQIKIKKSSEHVKKDRVYRKRKSSTQGASDEDEAAGVDAKSTAKKVHLQSNLDADSDFSIDSDSDEEEKPSDTPVQHQPTDVLTKNETQFAIATTESDKLEKVATDNKAKSNETEVKESKSTDGDVEERKSKSKIDKKKIWEKRTVGDVLLGAIQRYFERKLLREG